jgi:hypothetical protein
MHEDLPMTASPMCRLETEVVPVSTPIAARATVVWKTAAWARFAAAQTLDQVAVIGVAIL